MLVAVLVILLILLLGIGILFMVLTPRLREAEALQQRLKTWSTPLHEDDLNPILDTKFSDTPWLDDLLKKFPLAHRLDRLRQQAGSLTLIGTWMALSLGFSITCGTLGHILTPLPLLLILMVSGVALLLPFLYLSYQKKKRAEKFQEQLPDALDMLTRTIQAGHALIMGMKLVGEEFKDPLGPEFKRAVEHVSRWGIPFSEAMKGMTTRIDSLDLKYFVVALIIQREAGGALTEILSSLSGLIRKRFELKDRVRTLSAEGKISAIILFALPILIGLAMSFLNPRYLSVLFEKELGQQLLMGGVTLMGVGGAIVKKMISFKV